MIRLTCRPQPDRETAILIGAGIRAHLPEIVADLGQGRQVVALVDPAAVPDTGRFLPGSWRTIPLRGGESCKSFGTLEEVLRQLARWRLDRRTVLVAVGGGTLGDLAGLVATLYLRGIDLVQVPTTLLAMLDSSVGGKTAINIEEGKNLVGSFWPPRCMLADVAFAASLPAAHLASGLAEAIKMAIGFDAELFGLLESESTRIRAGDPELLAHVVTHAVSRKIETVEADPLETLGRRRCLNLGHTLAHALEALSGYSTLHGLAVAQGLYYCIDVAARAGLFDGEDAARCHALLSRYGFAREPVPADDALRPFFERDKKMQDGKLHFVVPTAIGACRTEALQPDEVLALGRG